MKIVWPVYNLKQEYNQYPGIMLISSLLQQHGYRVEVVDAVFDEVAAKLEGEDQAVLVAYSSSTVFIRHYLDLNLRLKERFPSITSVFGGPHPTYFPDMVTERGVDAVCVGEGEYAMLEFVQKFSRGESIHNIANWWVKDKNGIHRNPPRELVDDLDELPLPDHELFRNAIPGKVSQAIVITSRGCPYNCSYCYNHIFRKIYRGKGRMLRRRSVANVMAELRSLKKQGYDFIRFMDDLFILSPDWVREFSENYRREIGLPFSCLVRANYVTEEIMRLLKEAGCFKVAMGVEAGDERVRNEILKRSMSQDEILSAAKIVRQSGIRLVTQNIIGIPGGSLEADWETVRLNTRCRPNYASVSLLNPFPQTGIHEYAKAHGFLEERADADIESSLGFGTTSKLRFENPDHKRQLENLQKFFFLAVKLPWLQPVFKRMIKLPSNKFYDIMYLVMVNYGIHFCAVPPRIGWPILKRKIKTNRSFRRLFGSSGT